MQKQIWIASACTLAMLFGCSHEPPAEKVVSSKEATKAPRSESKPAKPEAKSTSADTDTTKAVTAAIDAWAAAWSKRDADAYLAAYAPDFKPEKGKRSAWAKQRRERIGKAKSIKVTIGNPQVKSTGPDRATATFAQTYESDSHKDTGAKKLELHYTGGKWLITRETSG